jgi:hypothetical protein
MCLGFFSCFSLFFACFTFVLPWHWSHEAQGYGHDNDIITMNTRIRDFDIFKSLQMILSEFYVEVSHHGLVITSLSTRAHDLFKVLWIQVGEVSHWVIITTNICIYKPFISLQVYRIQMSIYHIYLDYHKARVRKQWTISMNVQITQHKVFTLTKCQQILKLKL